MAISIYSTTGHVLSLFQATSKLIGLPSTFFYLYSRSTLITEISLTVLICLRLQHPHTRDSSSHGPYKNIMHMNSMDNLCGVLADHFKPTIMNSDTLANRG